MQSATYWTFDDKECNKGRSKEIGRNSHDGATNRCISNAEIIRTSEITF